MLRHTIFATKNYPLKRSERLDLLAELGHYLRSGGDAELDTAIRQSSIENQWFTEENIRNSLQAIAAEFLDRDKLETWLEKYPMADPGYPEKIVAIIMAGNIPLVGFQDWLCVFAAGQQAKVKLSDKDKRLLPLLVKKMGEWRKDSWAYTEFLGENDLLKGFDAVIATGSNNTARYFEQYFGKYPHIIRKNRNSVAFLDGSESVSELYALGRDIFSYFGLGCRNVSKLYVPHGYNFDILLEALHEYRDMVLHNKYKNNFDYNFTLFILNNTPFKNNGCLLLTENASLQARIASVHYEYYDHRDELDEKLLAQQNDIQCVVGKSALPHFSVIPFGQTQSPALDDYADGVDVMAFLSVLNMFREKAV